MRSASPKARVESGAQDMGVESTQGLSSSRLCVEMCDFLADLLDKS